MQILECSYEIINVQLNLNFTQLQRSHLFLQIFDHKLFNKAFSVRVFPITFSSERIYSDRQSIELIWSSKVLNVRTDKSFLVTTCWTCHPVLWESFKCFFCVELRAWSGFHKQPVPRFPLWHRLKNSLFNSPLASIPAKANKIDIWRSTDEWISFIFAWVDRSLFKTRK